MRITKVEAILLRPPGPIKTDIADGSQDALIVRVHTDAGIVGLGEVDSSPHVAKAIIEAPASHKIASGLGAVLIGEDPLQVGRLWRKMYDRSVYYGRRGAALHAISGVEIALWDVVGKALNKPIHTLIGGARRDKVKAYASTLMPDTPAEAARAVETQLKAGFKAVKLGWGPLGQSGELDVALVAAARKAGGPDFDLMIDVGFGWKSARQAINVVRRMEEHNPFWIEEPFEPDEYGKYAALAAAVKTPIAAGEEETTLADFERLVTTGGVEVVQPDVTRAGGILECLKIADYARRMGRRCVLHAWSTGIIKAATLHVLAAMDEAEYMEYCVQTTDLNQRLVPEKFPVVDGFVAIPNGPGLGIELDEKVLKEFTVA
ncbi:MAG TPA: mandelate racemase/muconate lactonizing enzyme family protein [Dongiaceae bacterium]|jgi:L-alanine-DL-glutamate epimerase-like enolase superfamily enzyme|nr:mandelate racemase/muconate lactonizing enzyme family protein [Dongiaceae bacterium]